MLQGIGYGRYPGRALIPCALIVAFGCLVFAPRRMEPKYPEDRPGEEVYHRFWYSLTLFMPFVKLQYEDAWRPKRQERWVWFYVRLHTLLGWTLVPFVLAAVTGILK